MNDALRMQISAFVDGELPENETELLLRRLSQDAALRQLVARYLLIGRLVRREREIPGMGELRGRIAKALGEEQPIEVVPAAGVSRPRWLKPAAGVAVAASVATLAVVGLRALDVSPDQDLESLRSSAAVDAAYTEPTPSEALPARPSETLMQYYVRHGETSADLGPNGILTRLVTLELRHDELVEVEPSGGTMRTGDKQASGETGDADDNDE